MFRKDRPVTPQCNRRKVLGALGTLGASAAAGTTAAPARAGHVRVGNYVHHNGIRGRMTGAQAVAAALWCEGVACVFGIPGAQNNELWDALKAREVPYLLVTNEASA